MNFERAIERQKRDAEALLCRAIELEEKHEAAKIMTAKLLTACKDKGITKLSICKRHKSVPSSMDFPFGAAGNLFTYIPKDNRDRNGWPPIWDIAGSLGLKNGCGNSNQTQVKDSELIDGVYHLKKGVWIRIKDQEIRS